MACSAARLKEIELALWAVDQSFNYGGENFEWAKEDGDLENIRSDARFGTMLDEWKKGTRKANQQPDSKQMLTLAQKFLTPDSSGSPPTEGATSQPTAPPPASTSDSKTH